MRVTYEMQSITQFSASQRTAKFALLFYLAPMPMCQIKRGVIHLFTKYGQYGPGAVVGAEDCGRSWRHIATLMEMAFQWGRSTRPHQKKNFMMEGTLSFYLLSHFQSCEQWLARSRYSANIHRMVEHVTFHTRKLEPGRSIFEYI